MAPQHVKLHGFLGTQHLVQLLQAAAAKPAKWF
jgi:hypothetical protein